MGGEFTLRSHEKAIGDRCHRSHLGANVRNIQLRSFVMSKDELLDPFGDRTVQATDPSRKTGAVSRLGVRLFLLLVLTLVVARIYYG